MITRLGERMRRGVAGLVASILAVGLLILMPASPALAHCDSVNGPVVTAARQALAQDDVMLVLPYVKADAETELTAAFKEAREAKKQGGKGAELAELWFAETAVRLHRQGEGAAYTGLKYETDFGPALHAAEEAVETGDLEAVMAVLDKAIRAQLEARYHEILETRERAAREGSVAADRAAVEAVLGFETYVHAVDEAIAGAGHLGESGGAHTAVTIQLNGQPLAKAARRHGEKLMLPLRAVAEAAGATVRWDEHEGHALVIRGDLQFAVRPGSDGALLHEGSLMVPAEALLQRLGLGHELHGDTLHLTR